MPMQIQMQMQMQLRIRNACLDWGHTLLSLLLCCCVEDVVLHQARPSLKLDATRVVVN